MNKVANRLIVFAAGVLAFGTLAFGQNRMTAEIPFAFHTVNATLPAGTYEFTRMWLNGVQHMVVLRNAVSQKSAVAGISSFDTFRTAGRLGPTTEFICVNGGCTLAAIRTVEGFMIYPPAKARKGDDPAARTAVVSLTLKVSNGD